MGCQQQDTQEQRQTGSGKWQEERDRTQRVAFTSGRTIVGKNTAGRAAWGIEVVRMSKAGRSWIRTYGQERAAMAANRPEGRHRWMQTDNTAMASASTEAQAPPSPSGTLVSTGIGSKGTWQPWIAYCQQGKYSTSECLLHKESCQTSWR